MSRTKKGVHCTTIQMTPTKAARMLERMPVNRTVKDKKYQSFARDMVDGNWKENGATIKLDPNGNLLDGQHRLKAVVESGCTVSMLVAQNVDPESITSIDTGIGRTNADQFKILGEANYATLAAGLRWLWHWARDNQTRTVKDQPSQAELELLLEANPGMRKSAEVACNMPRGLLTPSSSCCMHYTFTMCISGGTTKVAKMDWGPADEFFTSLIKGDTATGPIHTLRERLYQVAVNPRLTVTQVEKMAWTVKAWNAFRAGRTVRRYQWNKNEEFPAISD